MSWRTSVNQSVGVARIADIVTYVKADSSASKAPIDVFYKISQDILKAGTPDFLNLHSSMGPLLLVGLVSATENYFRDIFSRIIRLCPIAKSSAADQSVKLGSVIWHGNQIAERGAFEHISFADADNIVSASKKFLNYQLNKTDIVKEFEKVCELRHGIVHSGAIMAGKNAVRLQIPPGIGVMKIEVGFAQLQECGQICTTLVASINTDLFIETARRWAVEWPKLPFWNPKQKHKLFRDVWDSFYSTEDDRNSSTPTKLSLIRCRNQVAGEFK